MLSPASQQLIELMLGIVLKCSKKSSGLPTGYAEMSYYEKWAAASAAIAIERGTLTKAEYEQQLGPDPATLDNTVRWDLHQLACST